MFNMEEDEEEKCVHEEEKDIQEETAVEATNV